MESAVGSFSLPYLLSQDLVCHTREGTRLIDLISLKREWDITVREGQVEQWHGIREIWLWGTKTRHNKERRIYVGMEV